MLARYQLSPPGQFGYRESDAIVEIAAVDEDYDTLYNVQRRGGYGSRAVSKSDEQVRAAVLAYQKAKGTTPSDPGQLLPFFTAPPSPALLAKLKQWQTQTAK